MAETACSQAGNAKQPMPTRRQFLADAARAACGVGLLGLGLGFHANQANALPADALRPPGALAEDEFLAACTRCGLCVRDCPYQMLHLARLGDGIPLGTPYFHARTAGCEMCPDIPCVPVCPTGALSHNLTDINKARMGLAVLSDQETCIAFRGLRCEVCYNICPVRGKAITLEREHNARTGKHSRFLPTVHSQHCTGCGKCEQACILEESAIRVLPPHLVKGVLGKHYRLGWEQKADAGQALVTPDAPHQYNLPEGMSYEHAGRGLIQEAPMEKAPSALEQLNQGQGGL